MFSIHLFLTKTLLRYVLLSFTHWIQASNMVSQCLGDIHVGKMTNDLYVNARKKHFAFKITIILRAQLGWSGSWGGWGCRRWGGEGGYVMLKVKLGHSRSATSINNFKLLFQIHHSHTNQCSCPA